MYVGVSIPITKMCEIITVNNLDIFSLLLKCLVLLHFLSTGLDAIKNTCPLEISPVANSFPKVVWKSSGVNNEIVISHPPCTDKFGKLVERICFNATWFPKTSPICENIVTDEEQCPLQFEESTGKCVSISQPSSWDENCRFTRLDNEKSLQKELIWLPMKRKMKYGPYQSVTWGKDYGLPIHRSYNISFKKKDIFNKNCLVMNSLSEEIQPANCEEKHIHICPLSDDVTICPNNCVSAGIGTEKCYCKSKTESCRNLAKITSPFDKNVLIKLVEEEQCFLGNSVPNEFTLKGFRQSLSKQSWSYTDNSLNCSICLVPAVKTTSLVNMVLNFNDEMKILNLVIYLPLDLYGNGHEDFVYCFTDASTELLIRVNLKKVFEYSKPENNKELPFFVYNVRLENYIGQYWCEAYKKGAIQEPVVSNKVLAYKRKKGNEYSLRLIIRRVCETFDCSNDPKIQYHNFIPKNLTVISTAEIRVMEIFYFDFETLDFLLHISTRHEKNILSEFEELEKQIIKLAENIQIVYFKNSEFCLPEATLLGQDMLSWPLTRIGQVAIPNELCIQESPTPVFRMCIGNFLYGSEWSQVSGQCHNNVQPLESTKYIYSLTTQNLSQASLKNISKSIQNEVSILGIYYISKILQRIIHLDPNDFINDTLDIIDNLLKVNSKTLFEAQNILNVTDEILDSLEILGSKTKLQSHLLMLQKKNIILHITNPFISNISGVIIYYDTKEVIVDNFFRNTTINDIANKEHFQFAVHIPNTILEDWSAKNMSNINIITTIFFNDSFFACDLKKVAGPVVSITIPGYVNYLPSCLPIWFKTSEGQHSPTCAFWDYGKTTHRHKGDWSDIGGNYLGKIDNESSIDICTFSHLTHFALLVVDDVINKHQDDYVLTILTFTGDFLTVIGIGGIFSTAFLFKSWRRKQGTKILLNLSIAILLETLLTLMIQTNLIDSNRSCQIIGPMLHYVILSKYCWTLVYAFLQYMRFVKVLGPIPSNIVTKSVVFGWGFALIPVLSVCFSTSYNFGLKNYLLCYPKDLTLFLGLLMPLLLSTIVNIAIFYIVMRHVTTKTDAYINKVDTHTQKLQLQLATLLFFVLGLPVIIGVLSNFIKINWLQTILVYTFCITSNIQGFILFVFYVILNKETRNLWLVCYTGRDKSSSITTKSKS